MVVYKASSYWCGSRVCIMALETNVMIAFLIYELYRRLQYGAGCSSGSEASQFSSFLNVKKKKVPLAR